MKALLARWTGRSPRLNLSHLHLTVYSRPHCHCCVNALDLLTRYQARHGFTMEVIDIDTDPALVEKYTFSIPVVAVNGKVRFKSILNPVLLDRLFLAESQRS